MKRLALLLLMAITLAAQAQEQAILTATNDDNRDVEELVLRLDPEARPTHLLVRNSRKRDTLYPAAQIERGVVLKRQSGRDIVTLRAHRFQPDSGADLTLLYLVSGIPPEQFEREQLTLKRADRVWRVFRSQDPRPLKGVHFLTNRVTILGAVHAVGIRAIRFIHE